MNHTLFTPLNLPPRQLRLRHDVHGHIAVWDFLRGKWIVLTPEEWVRQHVVAHLAVDLGYPPSLMANEVGLTLNGLRRRCDAIVWRSGSASPLMVMEFKAPQVSITQRTLTQAARYNLVIGAKALLLSNGLEHFCCLADGTRLSAIPSYGRLMELCCQ